MVWRQAEHIWYYVYDENHSISGNDAVLPISEQHQSSSDSQQSINFSHSTSTPYNTIVPVAQTAHGTTQSSHEAATTASDNSSSGEDIKRIGMLKDNQDPKYHPPRDPDPFGIANNEIEVGRKLWQPGVQNEYIEPDPAPDVLEDMELLHKNYGKSLRKKRDCDSKLLQNEGS